MDIGEHISWHVELAIAPKNLPAFEQLTAEMVEVTHSEPGVLIYERYLSGDGCTVHVVERYQDSAAAITHLHTFVAKFGARFGALAQRKSFQVFGEPSAALRAMLTGLGATVMQPFNGFSAFAGH